jgi:hypothetical protein
MARVKKDGVREERIAMEVVVDAYGEEERAMGWYYYLEEALAFPFKAKCILERPTSPLEEGQIVEAQGMAFEEACLHEMFVEIHWQQRPLAVPLIQLEPVAVNDETQEAIDDWHYWVGRGYQF